MTSSTARTGLVCCTEPTPDGNSGTWIGACGMVGSLPATSRSVAVRDGQNRRMGVVWAATYAATPLIDITDDHNSAISGSDSCAPNRCAGSMATKPSTHPLARFTPFPRVGSWISISIRGDSVDCGAFCLASADFARCKGHALDKRKMWGLTFPPTSGN